jgi:hypothetical protein
VKYINRLYDYESASFSNGFMGANMSGIFTNFKDNVISASMMSYVLVSEQYQKSFFVHVWFTEVFFPILKTADYFTKNIKFFLIIKLQIIDPIK